MIDTIYIGAAMVVLAVGILIALSGIGEIVDNTERNNDLLEKLIAQNNIIIKQLNQIVLEENQGMEILQFENMRHPRSGGSHDKTNNL